MKYKKYAPLLTKLGISPREIEIYLSLLEISHGTISDIVRTSGVHRPAVYQWLPSLESRGLVSCYVKEKTKIYYAEPPDNLRRFSLWVQEELDDRLPDMMLAYESSRKKPAVRYFEGQEIVTRVYEDVLSTLPKGSIFYRYESPKDYKKMDEWLPSSYFKRVCKNKEIDKFVITNEKTAKEKKRVMERAERAVPASFDVFNYNITQIIYGHKVAFIDFEARVAWIIENPRFAIFQQRLFKLLFDQLPRV